MINRRNIQGLLGSERGIALVSVLWGLTLLSLVAANFAAGARSEVNLVYNHKVAAQAEALAQAGLERAVAGLFEPVESGGFRGDGSAYEWRFGGGLVRFEIWDEGGKVDLNQADETLLAALLEQAGLTAEQSRALAAAIADFRDDDDLTRIVGAEDEDYRQAASSHDAKDARFETVAELQQVLGMTATLYRDLEPLVTVHSQRAQPDEQTAPMPVRRALGVDLVGLSDPDDDIVPEEVVNTFEEDEAISRPVAYSLGTSTARSGSDVFRIHAEAQLDDGSVAAIDAVLQLTGNGPRPYRVLDWRRAERRLFAIETADTADASEANS